MREKVTLILATMVATGAIAALVIAITGGGPTSNPDASTAALSGAGAGVGGSDIDADDQKRDLAVPDGSTDGFKVYGHWTLEVTEPDGTFVSLTEFENALTPSGQESLARFLAHDNAIGHWSLQLDGATGAKPCNNNLGSSVTCDIWELPATDPAVTGQNSRFGDLVVEAPTSGVNEDKLVLTGSATVQNSVDIDGVKSQVIRCDVNSSPSEASSCVGALTSFTNADLNPVIPVLADQVVNVTLVISFS